MKPEYEGFKRGLIWRERERTINAGDCPDSIMVRGRCQSFVKEFIARFPELTAVPGHCGTEGWWNEHWWCVDRDGNVVDPTNDQFGSNLEYEPLSTGRIPYKIGRCMQCGVDIMSDDTPESAGCCSASCAARLEKECGREVG